MSIDFRNSCLPCLPFTALHAEVLPEPASLRAAITAAYRRDEREAVQWLLRQMQANDAAQVHIQTLARQLVQEVREKRTHASGVDALMHEFSLSSEEGVALMCLAEALLRIPDHQTADRLIADKIGKGDWYKHLGESPSLFVNAATWGLLITGKLVATSSEQGLGAALTRLIAKGGEPLIRKGVDLAMRMLGNQFVAGQTIEEALAHSRANEARGYRYSYDMLGEAALTAGDAAKYYAAYESAIHAIGRASNGRGIKEGPGISVKLSALHPRYSRMQRSRVMNELLPRLKQLLLLAKEYNIGLNIDAEEADRLELSLDLMEALAFDPDLAGFDGIGFVAQAYQKRCPFVIDYLADLAHRSKRRFMVRLVKGAYWDTEIKRAQVDGMAGYPVYTRKAYTDLSYLVCAQKLLTHTDVIYPQFATHNAHTLSSIYIWAQEQGRDGEYEFQCLHGMGETLYDQVVGAENLSRPCRIYAPVGSHETLLAYLVRRLLENGANTSFVNQVVDENISVDALIADPFSIAKKWNGEPHPAIALPCDLFGSERRNSAGLDMSNEDVLRHVDEALMRFSARQWIASPLLAGSIATNGSSREMINPADHRDVVGHVIEAGFDEVENALAQANASAAQWQAMAPSLRAALLMRAADLLEQHRLELMALAIREAGKSLPNAIAEVREAVDFLRYYAVQVGTQYSLLPQAGRKRGFATHALRRCSRMDLQVHSWGAERGLGMRVFVKADYLANTLPCRARTGLQACTVRQADDMSSETPASPPSPSPACGRGEHTTADFWVNLSLRERGPVDAPDAAAWAVPAHPTRFIDRGADATVAALGPVACISPWNFPLAIFIGQISAALAAGNVVLAKPAEQTPLIAYRAVQLLHEAGIPREALQFLPGRGDTVGAQLTADHRVCGVIFTGSTEVAQLINRTLVKRAVSEARDIPLIAETGGQNAMIVDSSALPEQVVQDALTSAFDSAGQRCSALRVLCLQADIADKTLTMLKGAMQELCIGNPDRLSVDIGPVIDADAQQALLRHIEKMKAQVKDFYQLPLLPDCTHGTFVAPTVIEITSLSQLQREVFGPVLHVLRYEREQLPQLVEAINATGYGLTLGIHSRIDETIDFITTRAHVGNIYVNRNIIGAVVGVQPFGGEGKSGTGPKAGGPLYLKRLQRDGTLAGNSHENAVVLPPAFASFCAWAKQKQERIAALCLHYTHASLLSTAWMLPGPTGERNILSFAPRGTVLCAAADTDAVLNQIAACLACGNKIVMPPDCFDLLPRDLPQVVCNVIATAQLQEMDSLDIHLALLDAAHAPSLLPRLATRDAALTPIVHTIDLTPIPLWRLLAERALCINTAAAGGNASLMTL